MLEKVTEKFRRNNCPFLEHADASTDQDWISGDYFIYFTFL